MGNITIAKPTSTYVCQTKDGKWYTPNHLGEPMETNLETIRMTYGEAAINLARRTKKVVNIVLEAYDDINPEEFVKELKQ